MSADDLSVAIQAGGESKRMGFPKATAPFLGEPLIMRSVRRLRHLTDDLFITTNDPDSYAFLADEEGCEDIRLVGDASKTRGALGGIYTALDAARHPYVAIAACDMIFPSGPLFSYEYKIAVEGGYDVVIPLQEKGWEPFHAVYRCDTCIELVRAALEQGEMKAVSWLPSAKLYEVSREEVLAADPRGGAFINANTPAELHDYEQRIRQGRMTFKRPWPQEQDSR